MSKTLTGSFRPTETLSPLQLAFNTERSDSTQPQYVPNNRGRGISNSYRGRGGYTSRGRGFPQRQTATRTPGERPVCQICRRVGHTTVKCYNRFNNNYYSEAFAALRISDETCKEWYPYAGAKNHVIPSASGLQKVSSYEGTYRIMVGDRWNLLANRSC